MPPAGELVTEAGRLGFGSVMYDASTRPYAQNVEATADIAAWCHDRGMWIEAEIGEIGGKDGAHAPGTRTRPQEAADYRRGDRGGRPGGGGRQLARDAHPRRRA